MAQRLQVRVAQKVALRSDALDVQLRLSQEELSLASEQNLLASQREQLNQLLGRDVRTAFEIEDITGVAFQERDQDASIAQALQNRPDLREARLKVEHAEYEPGTWGPAEGTTMCRPRAAGLIPVARSRANSSPGPAEAMERIMTNWSGDRDRFCVDTTRAVAIDAGRTS